MNSDYIYFWTKPIGPHEQLIENGDIRWCKGEKPWPPTTSNPEYLAWIRENRVD